MLTSKLYDRQHLKIDESQFNIFQRIFKSTGVMVQIVISITQTLSISCLATKNDHERLLANINYKKTLLELVEILGRLSSDRTFSANYYKSKCIEISPLPNVIHMSTINK
ncbi:hypothetical protein DPMN_101871 [Dreissena polymorpha]|uniref:Uncharacterized protein n=1 Tax=Dreissena polymorpha TaxID=45954 RepID=A0A9D4RAF4_DREPO|nr:hypothetical protein DPMN_101871 [Dreissena polymorpha]